MNHYVTLFDSLFMPQGLALHRSMERHAGAYRLWIVCMDGETHEGLARMALPNVRLLEVARLETADLLRVKAGRSSREYCWTLTPFAPRFVFEADSTVDRVTYVDADLWLRRDPAPIFGELDRSRKQVLITDHSYAPEHDRSATSGRYCVQFMVFSRVGSARVREWWEARCLEWCFARCEDGKFGDQKYLDDWPERFSEEVHVLGDRELALAPWNATRFPHGNAVFWHFHAFRILGASGHSLKTDLGPYLLPRRVLEHVYVPYIADLQAAVDHMQSFGLVARPQLKPSLLYWLKRWGHLTYQKMAARLRRAGAVPGRGRAP